MKRPKLGDAMFDDNDMFENLFAAINVCPKLGDAMFNDDIFSLPSFDMQICYDDSMPPTYDDYIDESGFGRVSTLGTNDRTILEGVESYCNNYESGFGEVMTLFSDESTISEEVSIDYYENKVAIYDDYGDDMYAIKNNDNHETCHHDFSFQLDYASYDDYFVEFVIMRRNWLCGE